MNKYFISILLFSCSFDVLLAQSEIPAVYSDLQFDANGALRSLSGVDFGLRRKPAKFALAEVTPHAIGAKEGLRMRFAAIGLRKGKLTYGLIPYGMHSYPTAVLRFEATIDSASGEAFLPIAKDLKDGYDHTGWQKKNFGVIGFRLTDPEGLIVYEGKQAFARTLTGFEPRPTVLRGPFVSDLRHDQAFIWYETSAPVFTILKTDVAEDTFFSMARQTRHEILLSNLQADREYRYAIGCDSASLPFRFRTAPAPGRAKFSFAYASDSRSGYGGGERNVYGVNAR